MTGPVLVTGATGGIGRALCQRLVDHGVDVVAVGRSEARLEALASTLGRGKGPRLWRIQADLGDLEQVEALADRVRAEVGALGGLVHGAGLMTGRRRESPQGHELQAAVHALAPARLTWALRDRLTPATAILTIASKAHRFGRFDPTDPELRQGWGTMRAYRRAKLLAVAWSLELAARTGLQVAALHPGVVDTPIGRTDTGWLVRMGWRLMGPLKIRPDQAASHAQRLLVADPALAGAYFDQARRVAPSPMALDPAGRAAMWDWVQSASGAGEWAVVGPGQPTATEPEPTLRRAAARGARPR